MTNQNIQAKTQIQNNTKQLSRVAVYCQLMAEKPHHTQLFVARKQGLQIFRIQQEHEDVVGFRKHLMLRLVEVGVDLNTSNTILKAFDENLAISVQDVVGGSTRAGGFLIGNFNRTLLNKLSVVLDAQTIVELNKLDEVLSSTNDVVAPTIYGFVSHDFLAKLSVKENLQTKVLQDILTVYEYVKILDNSEARFFQSMYLGGYNTSAITSTWKFLESGV